jgi:hypothetical protein
LNILIKFIAKATCDLGHENAHDAQQCHGRGKQMDKKKPMHTKNWGIGYMDIQQSIGPSP